MGMDIFKITYSFDKNDESKLGPLLAELENKLGGERKPYCMRAGALDIVTVLEIMLSVTIAVPISKYFEGLFLGDEAKEIGIKHRKQIQRWFSKLNSEIKNIVKTGQLLLRNRFVDVSLLIGGEGAIVVVVPLGSVYLYAILNHTFIPEGAKRNLSKGLFDAVKFLLTHSIPENTVALQLYFDRISGRWKYLFVPTNKGFGNWIDRYIDLDTGQIHLVKTRKQFFSLFEPEPRDEYKFLVSPFREERSR